MLEQLPQSGLLEIRDAEQRDVAMNLPDPFMRRLGSGNSDPRMIPSFTLVWLMISVQTTPYRRTCAVSWLCDLIVHGAPGVIRRCSDGPL